MSFDESNSYTIEDLQEFEKNIIRTKRDDGIDHCWLWHGKHTKEGYGIFVTNVSQYAHQFSYFRYKGKLMEGLQIDHKCEIRACVNPDHLQYVTRQENMKFIWTRTNVIDILYNVTNSEYQIVNESEPEGSKIERCAKYLEDSVCGIAEVLQHGSAPNYGRSTIIDMIDSMLKNYNLIFTNNDSEEFIGKYKRKWFWGLINSIYNFKDLTNDKTDDITLENILDYYTPDLDPIIVNMRGPSLWSRKQNLISLSLSYLNYEVA